MNKLVISIDQLIWLAYSAGINHGLSVHDEHVAKLNTTYGLDLIAEYTSDGVSEFDKMISENFIVDY